MWSENGDFMALNQSERDFAKANISTYHYQSQKSGATLLDSEALKSLPMHLSRFFLAEHNYCLVLNIYKMADAF